VPFENLRITPHVRRKLISYRERENRGFDIDLRTPFYAKPFGKGKPIEKSRISGEAGLVPLPRETIFEMLDELGVNEVLKQYPEILEFELDFRKYIHSARSIKSPYAERFPALLAYFKRNHFAKQLDHNLFEDAVSKATAMIRKFIPKASLRAQSLPKAMEDLPATTNWGMPYLQPGKDVEVDDKGNVIGITDNRPRYQLIAQGIREDVLQGRSPKLENVVF
jgi:hypothetical protein